MPARPHTDHPDHHEDRWVLALVCLAQFMVILDVSVVNVALPSMRSSLHLSDVGLQWVINAYTLTFAGFLLLGGRAADLFGRRRVFLLGLGLFTVASLVGGLATNGTTLLLARAAQGLGGAVLSPATLTILTTTFPEGPQRARALGAWSAVAGAGGAAGSVLGGIIVDVASWRWILFINVPIGIAAVVAARLLLRESKAEVADRALDVPGAVLVTGGLTALVYGIVETDSHGWGSGLVLGSLALGVALLLAFGYVEARVAAAPLVPLRLFRSRSLTAANVVMLAIGASIFASWYFLSLYLQQVLGYSPLETGFAFLPQPIAIIIGAQLSARLVTRVGARPLLVAGPLLSAVGLYWVSRFSVDSSYVRDLVAPMVLITFGTGLSFTPVSFAATAGVERRDAGLASGVINTARQVGGSFGLAALATLAVSRTNHLLAGRGAVSHRAGLVALTAGYSRALAVAACIAVVAAVAAGVGLPRLRRAPATEPHVPPGAHTAPAVAVPDPEPVRD